MRFQLVLLLIEVLTITTHGQLPTNNVINRSKVIHNDIVDIGNKCTCVPYYQCSDDSGQVVTDGEGLFDVRIFQEGVCSGYLDVCCNANSEPNTSPTTPEVQGTGTVQDPDSQCGFLKKMTIPWAGILQTKTKTQEWEYKCGASIIHPKLALTAAHCLMTEDEIAHASNYRVKVADYISNVRKIVVHPSYNSRTLHNDIASLILEEGLNHVGTICIPPPNSELPPEKCTVNTWSKFGRLRLFQVPFVPRDYCERLLRRTRLGPYFQLHASFICAGGNNFQDACDGDGGSPLICPVPGQPGRYHQVGIVSWGIGCGARDTPGVYVNVAAFRNWIDNVVQDEILFGGFYAEASVNNGRIKDGIKTYRY